jgi:hypothetical protein
MTTDLASLTSLILSALVADDALTAAELGALLGVSARELRPALLELEAAGAVVTSGRTRGTRYCLAIEEQEVAPVVAARPAPRIGGPRVRLPKVRTVAGAPRPDGRVDRDCRAGRERRHAAGHAGDCARPLSARCDRVIPMDNTGPDGGHWDVLRPMPMTPDEVADLVERTRAASNPKLVEVGRLNRARWDRRRLQLADVEAMQRRAGVP